VIAYSYDTATPKIYVYNFYNNTNQSFSVTGATAITALEAITDTNSIAVGWASSSSQGIQI